MNPVSMFAIVTEPAEAKNTDGGTLAYVGATLKCVEWYKLVRSVQVDQMR